MAELEQLHPSGVLSARALLDAVALIDQLWVLALWVFAFIPSGQ